MCERPRLSQVLHIREGSFNASFDEAELTNAMKLSIMDQKSSISGKSHYDC